MVRTWPRNWYPMEPVESRKQARRRLAAKENARRETEPLVTRAIRAARGNPGLQDLLTQAERDLLQASTLFQLPVPLDVLGRLAAGDQGTGRRLLAFGLWNAWPDPVDGQIPCAVIDPLAHRVAGELNDDEARSLAARAAGPLRSHWGNKALPDAAHELLRLGTLGQETGCILAGGTQALSRLLGRSCDAFSLLGQTDAVRQLEGLIGGA